MNRYPAPTHRTAFGFAAMALSAMTFGIFVVLPAKMDQGTGTMPASFAAKAAPPAASEVVISPARIEVVGEREEKTAFEPIPQARPKSPHAG